MKNKYDTLRWIESVFKSLKDAKQVPAFYRLIENYKRQFDIESYDPVYWELEGMKQYKSLKAIIK